MIVSPCGIIRETIEFRLFHSSLSFAIKSSPNVVDHALEDRENNSESCPEDTKSCEHLLKRVLKYGEEVGRLKAWMQQRLKNLQI